MLMVILWVKSHPMWVRGLKLETDVIVIGQYGVAPHVGAWIETTRLYKPYNASKSHPMWVRGLKHLLLDHAPLEGGVAPHVGAWIETISTQPTATMHKVAPHVGAWIETASSHRHSLLLKSHPMWVRGLKLP